MFIITKTPIRIPLGGGGTDLPFYYKKYGGSLVSAAIDKYIYVTVSQRRFYKDILLKYSKTECVNSIDELEHTRVREALRLLGIRNGIEITTMADVPAQTGMGTSSSFLVGLLNALHTYKREFVSNKKLAEEACKIEIDVLKEPIGKQDQYMASFGGVTHLNINKNGSVIVSSINIHEDTIKELEENLFLYYTGIRRNASEVIKHQTKAVKDDESKLEYMTQIKKIGEEIKKALEMGNLKRFGEWLNIHWETKKNFTKHMSSLDIDKWYDIAMKNGALGGKIMGAGGGGFFMFYCDGDKRKFREVMRNCGLQEMPFKFDLEGSKVLVNLR